MIYKKIESKNLEGSPYIFDDKMGFKTNTKLKLIGRYNAFTDQIEVTKND